MCLNGADKTEILGRQNKNISLTAENYTFAKWQLNSF